MLTKSEMFSLCVQKNLAKVGSEGLIYIDPESGRFLKERLLSISSFSGRAAENYQGRTYDPLAERKRKLLHTIANLALSASAGRLRYEYDQQENVEFSICFARIDQAIKTSEASFSVMKEVEGAPTTSEIDVLALAESLQDLGVEVDVRGQNIFVAENQQITIIEVIGGIHPEILKYAERLDENSRNNLLRQLAKLYLLGGCEGYPTVNPFFTLKDPAGKIKREDPLWEQLFKRFEAFKTNRINLMKMAEFNAFRKRADLTALSQRDYFCATEGVECLRAWNFFGPQFTPQTFDWERGRNLEVYGIDPDIFRTFSKECDRLRVPFSRIRQDPAREIYIPVKRRAELLERIAELAITKHQA